MIHTTARLEARYGADETRRLIGDQVAQREREALAESKRRGIPFKGARRIVRTPQALEPTPMPLPHEPLPVQEVIPP